MRRFDDDLLAAVVSILLTLALWATPAAAGPLDPTAFTSLGSLSLTSTSTAYTLDTTSGVPTLTGDGLSFTGVVSGGVAVFDFDTISIAPDVTLFAVSAFNSLPVAILSRSDANIAGTLDVSAFANLGGPGANLSGLGRDGSDGSTGYGPDLDNSGASGGGGGGFGGAGGGGGAVTRGMSSMGFCWRILWAR